MKKATLGQTFAALRAERHLTLLAIALACDIAETTVLKVEAGRPVRWETLHLILSVGMGIHIGTEKYEEFHRLWLMARAEMAESKTDDHAKKALPKHSAAAVKKFRSLIRDLDEKETRRVMAAVSRAVTR